MRAVTSASSSSKCALLHSGPAWMVMAGRSEMPLRWLSPIQSRGSLFDLHASRPWHVGRAVKQDHEREAWTVGDGFQMSASRRPVIRSPPRWRVPTPGEPAWRAAGREASSRRPDSHATSQPSALSVHPHGPLAGTYVEAAGEVFGDGGHATGSPVTGMAVFVRLALGVGETSRPLRGGAGVEPAVDEVGEAVAPDRKKLGAVVEGAPSDASGRHPATNAAALVEDGYVPAFSLQRAGGEQARDAGPDDEAGFSALRGSLTIGASFRPWQLLFPAGRPRV